MRYSDTILIKYFLPCFMLMLSFSQVNISGYNLGQLFGWISIAIACRLTYKFSKQRILVNVYIVLLIVFRLASIRFKLFYSLYDLINIILFFNVGLILFNNYYNLVIKQLIFFIIIINAPIMFLQLMGVDWVNYHCYSGEYNLTETMFLSINEVYNVSFPQMRPAGVLWSNQPLGLFVAIAASLIVFHTKKFKWIIYFLLSLVVVFCSSKFVYFMYSIILIAGFIFANKTIRRRIFSIISSLLIAVFFFKTLFPGLFKIVIGIDRLLMSIYVRLYDLEFVGVNIYKINHFKNIIDIVEKEQVGQVRGFYHSIMGTYLPYSFLSILYQYKIIALIFVVICILLFVKYQKSLKTNEEYFFARLFCLISILLFSIVNPSQYYSEIAFFLSFSLSYLFTKRIKGYNKIAKYLSG